KGEISGLLSFVAGRDQGFHLGIGDVPAFYGRLQDIEDRIEALQQVERVLYVSQPEFTGIHGGVDVPDELKYGGKGLGSIQIVVHRSHESLLGCVRSRPERLVDSLAKALCFEPELEIAQPL